MMPREQKNLPHSETASNANKKSKNSSPARSGQDPPALQRETSWVEVQGFFASAGDLTELSTGQRRLYASSMRSGGGRTPTTSECSQRMMPVSANYHPDLSESRELNLSPCTAILQHDNNSTLPNYFTSSEARTPVVEVKGEDSELMSAEDIDIHSLGERLTDVLETSFRSSVSTSQRGEGQNSMRRAAFHIFKGNVGAGVFLLPTYYQDAGYVVGLITALLLGVLMTDCSLALVHAKQKINRAEVRTYPAVVEYVLGRTLMHFTKFSLIFTQFGFCVVYIQYASSMFTALFGQLNTYRLFVFISILLVTPLTFFSHRMGLLSYASILAAIFVVAVLAGAVGEEISALSTRGIANGTVFFLPTMRILVFISGHMFALEGIGIVLPVENSMCVADRPRFPTLVKYTLATVVFMYIVFGLLGYLAFGETLQTSVVLAMPPSIEKTVMQVLLGLSLIFGYPIQYVPAIQLVDRALGINVHSSREMAFFVRILLNLFFGTLAGSIGAETINIFASFLGAFTGVHLMITVPVLLALFTDNIMNEEQNIRLSHSDYFKIFITRPNTLAGYRWYFYLFFAMVVWIGGTYYTFESVFAL